jgi:glutamine synthetase
MKVQAEYIWMDGAKPTSKLRSKTKIVEIELGAEASLTDFPEWGFDGSSTFQADGHDSDRVLKPVAFVKDPIRLGEEFSYSNGGVIASVEFPNYLVLCEVFYADGRPHETNTRAELRRVLEAGASNVEPWFGIEQEYTLFKGSRPLGFPGSGYPAPQGPYYCGVGADEVVGRPLIEAHTKACLAAELLIAGTNAEVMPGQWEFQIGAADPLTVADHLWFARWLLYRLGEDFEINATLDPKPAKGDWNGAGAHTNFSTKAMRTDPNSIGGTDEKANFAAQQKLGIHAIKTACQKLGEKHAEHIAVYGDGIEARLTGKHETCSFKEFRWGVADRGASLRIPRHVKELGYGYFEDRRPCANIDPYVVCARILKTVCDIE